MAGNKPITRAYTGRLFGLNPDLAWSHHVLHNQAVASVFSTLLTFRAGVPAAVADADDRSLRRLRRNLVTSWWFTVELPHEQNHGARLVGDDVVDQLKARISSEVNDDLDVWLADVEPLIDGRIREDAVWVDRRKCWDEFAAPNDWDWSEVWNDVMGMTGLDLGKLLVTTDGSPVPVAGWERPSSSEAPPNPRSFASNRFGTGKKSDFNEWGARLKRVLKLVLTEGISGTEFKDSVGRAEPSLFDGKRGAPGTVERRYKKLIQLPSLSMVDIESWRSGVEDELGKAGPKSRLSGSRPWADLMLENVIAVTGTPRTLWGSDPLSAVLNGAQGRIASATSLNKRHVEDLLRRHDEASAPTPSGGEEAYRLLDDWVDLRTVETGAYRYRVGRRAVKGLEKVEAAFDGLTSSEERIDAINRVRAAGIHVGDQSLFTFVAHHPEVLTFLSDYANREDARAKAEARLIPTTTLPTPEQNPVWAQFGNNNWPTAAAKKGVDRRTLILRLWDGTDLVNASSLLVSGRVESDLTSVTGAPRAARADRLGRLAATATTSAPGTESAAVEVTIRDKSTITLAFDRRTMRRPSAEERPQRWHAHIALKLIPAGPLDRFEANGHKIETLWSPERPGGLRVLGVDLGLTTLAAWSVWETLEPVAAERWGIKRDLTKGPGTTAADVVAPWARFVDAGSVGGPAENDRQRKRREQREGRPFDWFESWALAHLWGRLNRPVPTVDRAGRRPVTDTTARRGIPEVVRDAQRAVREHNRVAMRIRRLGGDEAEVRMELAAWHRQLDAEPESDRSGLNRFENDPVGALTDLTRQWQATDEVLRDVVRFVRLLVFGGRLSIERAARFGLRPRNSLPIFGGFPERLSPERFKTLDDVYRLAVMHWSRSTPSGEANARGERLAERLMDNRARVRDDLAKQVASQIVREALRRNCTVIAIEDLDNLVTRSANTRATNKMLRRWAKVDVTDRLKGLCELHRIHLDKVRAAGTSRMFALTGEFGLRYEEVDARLFREKDSWASRRVEALRNNTRSGDGDWAEAVQDWLRKFDAARPGLRDSDLVALPQTVAKFFMPGGKLTPFAPPPESRIDADENAAGNIALRFLSRFSRPKTDVDDSD